MNLENNQDIVSAQIIKILKSRIFLKTEHGKTIVVEYPRKQRKSHQAKQLFTQILKDIWGFQSTSGPTKFCSMTG